MQYRRLAGKGVIGREYIYDLNTNHFACKTLTFSQIHVFISTGYCNSGSDWQQILQSCTLTFYTSRFFRHRAKPVRQHTCLPSHEQMRYMIYDLC